MKTRVKIALVLVIAATATLLYLSSAAARWRWVQISDTYFSARYVCTDGMVFGIAHDYSDKGPTVDTPMHVRLLTDNSTVFSDTITVSRNPIYIPGEGAILYSGIFNVSWSNPVQPGSKLVVEKIGGEIPIVSIDDCTIGAEAQKPIVPVYYESSDTPKRIPAVRAVYIYKDDLESRDAYVTLLENYGIEVDAVDLQGAETYDFHKATAVIIGDDTRTGSTWAGSPLVVQKLYASQTSVIELGWGGLAFLQEVIPGVDLSSYYYFSGGTTVQAADPTNPIWSTPYYITGSNSNEQLYWYSTPYFSFTLEFFAEAGFETAPIGRDINYSVLYPVNAVDVNGFCHTIWGFLGSPDNLSIDGSLLLVNAVMTDPCARSANVANSSSVQSSIEITQTVRVTDIDLMLNIDHPTTSDLEATLISPQGTRVDLFYQVGGDGDDFGTTCGQAQAFEHAPDTVLDDESVYSIVDATAPFTQTAYTTQGPVHLQDIYGQPANGTWTLEVNDFQPAVDSGQLWCWSLYVKGVYPLYLPMMRYDP
jgi:subtilisin-like proprotein convertase family protein